MKLSRRAFITGSAVALSTRGLAAQTTDIVKIEGPAFGADWRVSLPIGADTDAVIHEIKQIIASVDATMSPFNTGSEISEFNRSQSTQVHAVSADILKTVVQAKRMAAFTQGAFDPTVGGIVGRYGFGPITTPPAGAFADLRVSASGLRKSHVDQTLDLCGIAKGFALDRIVAALCSLGNDSFFVELGGEVFARGYHPDGRPWRSGIAQPLAGLQQFQKVVSVTNEAVATSGDQINSYHLWDHGYSHIIDPHNLRPTDSTLASVTVFAPQAITADALATALFAMGPEAGVAFAQREKLSTLFLLRNRGGLREIMTGGFSTRVIG